MSLFFFLHSVLKLHPTQSEVTILGIGFFEFIILILIYPLAVMLGAVMIGIGIALDFRWGSRWLLKIVYTDSEFEKWLKRVLNASENQTNNGILGSTTEN